MTEATTEPPKTYRLVFVRHGESEWNASNQFTGWYDAGLTTKGLAEAVSGGKALKNGNFKFDVAFTSVLQRANITLDVILQESNNENIPVFKTWRLNERHYGGLTGQYKHEAVEKFGAEQVQIWRRSFATPPPPMDKEHPFYEKIVYDGIYENQLEESQFPMAESLELTIQRTLPYWNDTIIPALKAGRSPVVVAHGNSLRGIVMHLDKLTNDQIMALNLPTGIPFFYELDENFKPIVSMQFLGDEETVRLAMEKVANQTKVKK